MNTQESIAFINAMSAEEFDAAITDALKRWSPQRRASLLARLEREVERRAVVDDLSALREAAQRVVNGVDDECDMYAIVNRIEAMRPLLPKATP